MDDPIHEPAGTGALAELVEVENQAEAELSSAAVEAARILEAARAEARSIVAQADRTLESELAALRESIDRDGSDSIRRLEDAARAEVQRYRDVEEATVEKLARWLAARVTGGGSQG